MSLLPPITMRSNVCTAVVPLSCCCVLGLVVSAALAAESSAVVGLGMNCVVSQLLPWSVNVAKAPAAVLGIGGKRSAQQGLVNVTLGTKSRVVMEAHDPRMTRTS